MSLTTARHNFEEYLRSPIERYPVAKTPLSLKPKQNYLKELIFQQSLFLKIADQLQSTKPWVTYFATTKHFRLLEAKGVNTATFDDLRDKEFSTEVAATAESLRSSAIAALDRETTTNLDHLCRLQEAAPLVAKAYTTLSTIASSKNYKTILRLARGEKISSGCLTVAIAVSIIFVICCVFSSIFEAVEANLIISVIFLLIALPGGVIAWKNFSDLMKARAAVVHYQSDIVPVAEMLGAYPLTWLGNPDEGLSSLAKVDSTRRQFEETYLDCS